MAEYLDLYDENRKPLGRTYRRGDALRPGEYFTVAEIWTVNAQKLILVTLRAPDKNPYPNKWENTGGAVLAGETSLEGAVRELREETGIIAEPEELVLLGSYLGPKAFVDVYLLRKDAPLETLTMQEGETVEAKWVTLDELFSMRENGELAFSAGTRVRYLEQAFHTVLSGQP